MPHVFKASYFHVLFSSCFHVVITVTLLLPAGSRVQCPSAQGFPERHHAVGHAAPGCLQLSLAGPGSAREEREGVQVRWSQAGSLRSVPGSALGLLHAASSCRVPGSGTLPLPSGESRQLGCFAQHGVCGPG